MHILHRDGVAHEAEQPPVEEEVRDELELDHVVVQIVYFAHHYAVDVPAVHLEELEVLKVNHA